MTTVIIVCHITFTILINYILFTIFRLGQVINDRIYLMLDNEYSHKHVYLCVKIKSVDINLTFKPCRITIMMFIGFNV